MLLANFDRKEHLQHRAVSLRQHGFLVRSGDVSVMDENSLTPALGVFSLISLAFLYQFNLWGSLQDDKMPIFGYI